ncbi:MAG: hypothetical protein SF052_15630 [Bacteroidia bacterium]|nr:hypothetical protein [Bacteroidia bacterium]
MKKIVCSVVVLLSVVSLFAQNKPVAKDISLGFRITGLGNVAFEEWGTDAFEFPQVMGRYYLSDRVAVRARLGVGLTNVTSSFDRSVIDTENFGQPVRIDSSINSTVSAFSVSFAPGVEYHLLSDAAKLDPYVAAEIPFALLGTNRTDLDLDVVRTDAAGTRLYREDVNIKTDVDGGISAGLNLIGGFNYFFSPKFAIGAEYSLGFGYTKNGGTVVVAQTGSIQPTSDTGNIIPIDQTDSFNNSVTVLGLGVQTTGGVNVSIFW